MRWEIDAIITDVPKTWLEMRAALNGTRGRGQIRQRADGQFQATSTKLAHSTGALSSGLGPCIIQRSSTASSFWRGADWRGSQARLIV